MVRASGRSERAVIAAVLLMAVAVSLVAGSCSVAGMYSQRVTDPPHNATGDGVTDDTQAIQNCINAVHDYLTSHPDYRGEVIFPAGTYRVSPVINQPYTCLNVYKDITLVGNTDPEKPAVNPSVVKVIDNTKADPEQNTLPYLTLMGAANGLSDDLSGFGIRNMTFDGNMARNPTRVVEREGAYYVDGGVAHMCLYVYTGSGIMVQNSVFRNFCGSQVLYIGDYTPPGCSNVTIDNCHFADSGTDWGTYDYDTSTLYTTGDNFTVTNCHFDTLHGAGTRGARTAMEFHGTNQRCAYNVVDGHAYGINAVGDSPGRGSNQRYVHNTFTNMYVGMLLWSFGPSQSGSGGGGLRDCTISNNTFTININGWNTVPNYQWAQPTIGLAHCSLPIGNLTIEDNTITFTNYELPGTSRNVEKDSMGMGIGFENESAQLSGVIIRNNMIMNPLTNGIYANVGTASDSARHFEACVIDGNTIINPGSSPFAAQEDEERVMLSNEQKAAIRMSGNTNAVRIPSIPLHPSVSNVFADSRVPRRMSHALWTDSRVGSDPALSCVFDATQTHSLADPSNWMPFKWGGVGPNQWTVHHAPPSPASAEAADTSSSPGKKAM